MNNKKTTIHADKLIRGIYEKDIHDKDNANCDKNILYSNNLIHCPIIDQLHLESGGKKPKWPNESNFAVCLSHDVDMINSYSFNQSKRKFDDIFIQESLKKKVFKLLGSAKDFCLSTFCPRINDPYHQLMKWIEIEKDFDCKSTFFFWPGRENVTQKHFSDCLYELKDYVFFNNERCSTEKMIQKIDQLGWEIGLHSSWFSYNNLDTTKKQKLALEKIVEHPINSVRQHWLHYDYFKTPGIHVKAGFKYDSSIGFNDNIGFRLGTSYPTRLYNNSVSKEYNIIEIPLIIQDVSLFRENKGLNLNNKSAIELAKTIIDKIEQTSGVLTLSWHTNTICNDDYINTYIEILKYLKSKRAWISSIENIGDWWQKNNPEINLYNLENKKII